MSSRDNLRDRLPSLVNEDVFHLLHSPALHARWLHMTDGHVKTLANTVQWFFTHRIPVTARDVEELIPYCKGTGGAFLARVCYAHVAQWDNPTIRTEAWQQLQKLTGEESTKFPRNYNLALQRVLKVRQEFESQAAYEKHRDVQNFDKYCSKDGCMMAMGGTAEGQTHYAGPRAECIILDEVSPKQTYIYCTRRIQFCAGHRVMGHENKCAHLHGHNYVVHLRAQALPSCDTVDGIGRVVDFSVLKEKVGGWIENFWDHGFILHRDDVAGQMAMGAFITEMNAAHYRGIPIVKQGPDPFKQKTYFMPYNPTAENMAKYLLEVVGPEVLKGLSVRLVGVIVEETENCNAEASLSL